MKKLSFTLIYFCAFVLALVSVVITPSTTRADRTQPNWLAGEPIYQEGNNFPQESECVMEERTIRPIYPRIYDTNSPGTTRQVCVYKADGYEYAYYQRFFQVDPTMPIMGTKGEGGIAIALNGSSEMIPTQGINNSDIDTVIYLGYSRMMINQVRVCNADCFYHVSIYRDVEKHLKIDNGGYMVLDGAPDFTFKDRMGAPIKALGASVSLNKKWLVVAVPNTGLVRLSLDTFDAVQISDRFEYQPWTYPRPVPSLTISDEGSYIVSGGWNMATQIVQVDNSCGVYFNMPNITYIPTSIGLLNCPYRDVTHFVQSHSQMSGYPGMIDFTGARMSSRGSYFTYFDRYKWNTIYAPNYLLPGQLYYLALGDSYASGEGDLTLDGADHYQSGTNIYGNYNLGIPRETCHSSTRAYSMRIAAAMQLTPGGDMRSIACSGAVVTDILTSNLAGAGYINSSYLGQPTQQINNYAPRLSGVPNAQQLQDDARSSYIPGRVQQIELVKKSQPKYATVMVGGNDVDFAGVMMACAKNALPAAEETCDYAHGDGLAGAAKKIYDLYPKLVDFYKALQEVSPHTTLYVIGYPQFMDENNESCAEMSDLYTISERKAIHNLIAFANGTIRAAALDSGVKYIDVSDALAGTNLCSSGTTMTGITDVLATMVYTEYMKTLTMSDSSIAKYLNILPTGTLHKAALKLYVAERAGALLGEYLYSPATTIASLFQELSHPNALGHEAIYSAIEEGLGDELLESTVCNERVSCPGGSLVGRPHVEDYIPGLLLKEGTVYSSGNGKVSVGHKDSSGKTITGSLVKSLMGQFIRIAITLIDGPVDQSSPVTVELHSKPTVLGTMKKVGDMYELITSLPSSIPVGQHILHIKGGLVDGRVFDIDLPVFVEGPLGDIDDDGIRDELDTCAFGLARGSDVDADRVDDACDLYAPQTSTEARGSKSTSISIVFDPDLRTSSGTLANANDARHQIAPAVPLIDKQPKHYESYIERDEFTSAFVVAGILVLLYVAHLMRSRKGKQ